MIRRLFSILTLFSLLITPALSFANEEGEHAAAAPAVEEKHSKTATQFFPKKQADKTMATRPEAPELLEPAFMTKVTGGSVTLKWKEVAGSTNYHFQLATDPNFKWLVKDDFLFQGTSYQATGLEAGKHYYWRVAAQKGTNDPAYTKSGFNKSMFETH